MLWKMGSVSNLSPIFFTASRNKSRNSGSFGESLTLIIGGLSGRLDHTLANLSILQDLHARHIHGYITDGNNRAHYIKSTSHLVARSAYKYLSLIAVDETCKGVSIKGCKYELKNQPVHRRLQFAVSNEITGNCALVSVKKGGLYVIESREQSPFCPAYHILLAKSAERRGAYEGNDAQDPQIHFRDHSFFHQE